MDRRAWNVARLTAIVLVLVSLRLIYWQMVRGRTLQPVAVDLVQAAAEYEVMQAGQVAAGGSAAEFLTGVTTLEELQRLPQPVIQRTINLLDTITRGAIYDRNGRLLAADLPTPDGNLARFYYEPSLAHTLGYASGLRTGVAGLELTYNDILLGLNRPDSQIAQMLNQPITGSDLLLTVDSYIQRAAEHALRERAGAILVLDGSSGAILALASAPRFDPNRILDETYVTELLEGCDGAPTCQAPLLNRATQGLYSPGSTFKTVALIAALDSGQVTANTVFDFGEPIQGENGPYYEYAVGGGTIPDFNHTEQQLDLAMSFAKSANAAFAQIGDEMPPDTLIEYAARFGFGAPGEIVFPLDIEHAPAQLAQDPRQLYENDWLRAATAIGQGELLGSPLNVGMVVLAVLGDGDLPVPYLVEAIREPDGTIIDRLPNRRVLGSLMEPETAALVRQMMLTTVQAGSGQNAHIPGVVVGGKTGTAQLDGDQAPHAWFAGFAQSGKRSVVVVVLVEHGGEGAQTAAPIFAEVAQAALFHLGEPVAEVVPAPAATLMTPADPTQPVAVPSATSTPGLVENPTATPVVLVPPTEPPSPTPMPAATATPAAPGVLPPDILRDPTRNDITAANPTCANLRDMPQATGAFLWPSPYQALSGGDFREGHPGFDLGTPPGSPVYAADTGLVVFAGWSGLGYGNAVLIDHGNGYQTLYAHLSQISMYCGARVEKGKLIGLSGDTGNSSGPHLHFEVRVPGGYIDPLKVLPVP